MKKYVLILVALFPAMLWGDRGDRYVGNGSWSYIAWGGTGGFPVYRVEGINFAWGGGAMRRYVPGIGIGASIGDVVSFYDKGWQAGGWGPLYLRFMVPLSEIKSDYIVNKYYYPSVLHFFASVCPWGYSFDRSGFIISWFVFGGGIDYAPTFPFLLGIEAGFLNIHNKDTGESKGSFYAGIKLGVGEVGGWFPVGPKLYHTPEIVLSSSFTDPDGNGVLQKGEKGKIFITLENVKNSDAVKGRLKIELLSPEYRDKISFTPEIGIWKIPAYKEKRIVFPVKAIEELPRGNIKFQITYTGKATWGEKVFSSENMSIPTMPTTGMIKVAFRGLDTSGLPSFITPTKDEYADYLVTYKNRRIEILNLYTGEKASKYASSASKARFYVRSYFEKWDRENPKIFLSTKGGMVRARKVKISARFSDDRKIDKVRVYLNGNLFKEESFAERTEVEREYIFPFNIGENTVRFVLTDWIGKEVSKSISFTRIRGGGEIAEVGTLPKGAPPPRLSFTANTLDGDNTVVGGKEEGIKVVVRNRGKGTAKWVRVALEGDNTLLRYWGTERNLEDIKPGRSKSAEFSLLMPTDLPRKTAAIKVSIKEGRGYSPTIVKTLNLNLVPAEKRIEKEELVQDVDYDIPNGKISRESGYALIIGLSKYSNATSPKYSRNDAEVFSKYVSKVLGIRPSHIKTIYDDKATCSIIKANLTDWLKRKKGFKVIYFAGHGVPDPENPREGDVYLLPYDGDPELKSTLISLRDIAEIGANAGDTILLVLDACFSGGKGRTVELASRPLSVAKIPETNAITLAAAEGNQPSKEYEKAKHGYFTYYVLLGLKGKADKNRDGWITTTELYRYVKEKVKDATNNVQVPVLRPMRDIKIGRVK